ncbi:MAG: OadG family protein [Candidatus Pacebacteria bacterium]|nr:OadG family protein [Candidatus Paceibacterota bacterium]
MLLLLDGLKLLVAGMGMVTVFLCLMIACIYLNSLIASRFSHVLPEEPLPSSAPGSKGKLSGTPANQSQSVLPAVITAAIQMYRRENRNT